MKTIIAIKGHATRCKEVIEILEMLGGKNTYNYSGDNEEICFCIGETTKTIYYEWVKFCCTHAEIIMFTLEEFLEKYPYKVGDKVYNIIHNENQTITNLSWDFQENEVVYQTDNNEYVYVNYLQPYKETMNTKIAIKGHKTRGKEVIEILEMLGGKNEQGICGNNPNVAYYISHENTIVCDWCINGYTLEEFLEKCPYKVGDKVTVTGLPEYPKIINFMEWFDGDIHYSFDNETWFLPSELNLYKEEIMEVKRMAQLAIKGHPTRDKEVIEILEMLGGKNDFNLIGDACDLYYYINNDNKITYTYTLCNINDDFKIFTIEEFFEKYPYKIGDVVMLKGDIVDGKRFTINHMFWNGVNVKYDGTGVDNPRNFYSCSACRLLPYKNETETMEERKYSDLRLDVDQDDKLSTEVTIDGDKITPPENYLIGKVTTVDNGLLVEFVKKRPQLPKTYEECCKVLGIDPDNFLSIRNLYRDDGEEETTDYESDLLEKFDHLRELTICRKAYWKIAGEQMGLDKPWKPDWLDTNTQKYCIYYVGDEIKKQPMLEVHHFLAFPTKEMSDEFFENFKELIESCEEFL